MSAREKGVFAALLAAALGVRLLYCFSFSPFEAAGPVFDISWYHEFAVSLRDHGALLHEGAPSAAREPVYPLFLAAIYTVLGEGFPQIWIAQSLLGAATVGLVFLLAGRTFSRNVAWAAAALAAFYPQFIFYAASPERETLQVLLLLAAMLALCRGCRRGSLAEVAGAAGLWALSPLTNSSLLPAAALAGPGAWLLGRRLGLDLRRHAAVFLAVFALGYGLWPLRNFLVFGRFIPGITAGGAHLYVSLIVPNEAAGTPREHDFIVADPVMRAGAALPEDERDRFFYRASARWILAHPLGFARIMAASFLKLWRLYPYPRDYGMRYRVIKAVSLLSDGWLIPLGLLGLLLAGRRFPETELFNLVLFAITSTYMIFWAIIRYRLPMMPYVLIYAAYALERGAARWLPGRLPYPVSAP